MSKLIPIFLFFTFSLLGAACVPVGDLERAMPTDNQGQVNQPPNHMMELNMDLIAAAEQGDLEMVQSLLAQGADVRASNTRGVTPLIAAAYQNH